MLLLGFCSIIGTGVLNDLQASSFQRNGDRLLIAAWLGLMILATGLLATSLLLPLSPLVGLIIALGLCGVALRSPITRIEVLSWSALLSKRRLLVWIPLVIGVAAIMVHPIIWWDTGLYHSSVIQWLAQFGAVPGVALLFANFGFTSSWFAIAAPFSTGGFAAQMNTVATGFALLLAGFQFCLGFTRSLHNQAQISDWFAVAYFGAVGILIAIGDVHRQILISASPDLPIAFLVGAIAWTVVIMATAQSVPIAKPPLFSEQMIPLILAAGAVTVKLIALPILAASFLVFVAAQPNWRTAIAGSLLTGFMLVPLAAHGTITSGCPLFPSTALCFALPWSPAAEVAKQVSDSTSNWVSWDQPPSNVNPWLWRLQRWFNYSKTHRILTGFIALSVPISFFLARKPGLKPFGKIWLIASGLGGVAFIMQTAPNSRFLLPYPTLLPASAVAVVCHWRFKGSFPVNITPISRKPIAVSLFAIAVITVLVIKRSLPLLLPPSLNEFQTIQKQTNDIVYRSPVGKGLCWNTIIPCAFEISEDVKLRHPDQGIRAGFIRR
jgi:hypothetical protein